MCGFKNTALRDTKNYLSFRWLSWWYLWINVSITKKTLDINVHVELSQLMIFSLMVRIFLPESWSFSGTKCAFREQSMDFHREQSMDFHFWLITPMKGKFETDPRWLNARVHINSVFCVALKKCFSEQHGKFLSVETYLYFLVHCF